MEYQGAVREARDKMDKMLEELLPLVKFANYMAHQAGIVIYQYFGSCGSGC